MDSNGVDYDRTGQGEPLLLLHGTGGSRRHWRPVIDMLAGHHDVIAVDLPGHAKSGAPPVRGDHSPVGYATSLADFLDGLGIASAHVAGNSVGGWTALELAKLGKARSVTAIAPAGLWARQDPWRCVVKLWANYRLGRLTRPLIDRALNSETGRIGLLRGTVAKPLNLTEDEARDLIETYNATPTFTTHLAHTRRGRFQGGAAIDVPVTVAWGDDDKLIPASARRNDELPAHAATVTLTGCGHVPFWDDPDQVAQTILTTTNHAHPYSQPEAMPLSP
jgi:pimeloyl-ACP methyl ester carboxylesterase